MAVAVNFVQVPSWLIRCWNSSWRRPEWRKSPGGGVSLMDFTPESFHMASDFGHWPASACLTGEKDDLSLSRWLLRWELTGSKVICFCPMASSFMTLAWAFYRPVMNSPSPCVPNSDPLAIFCVLSGNELPKLTSHCLSGDKFFSFSNTNAVKRKEKRERECPWHITSCQGHSVCPRSGVGLWLEPSYKSRLVLQDSTSGEKSRESKNTLILRSLGAACRWILCRKYIELIHYLAFFLCVLIMSSCFSRDWAWRWAPGRCKSGIVGASKGGRHEIVLLPSGKSTVISENPLWFPASMLFFLNPIQKSTNFIMKTIGTIGLRAFVMSVQLCFRVKMAMDEMSTCAYNTLPIKLYL